MSESTTAALSAAELEAFRALLDVVIPPSAEHGMPGAGEAGLAPELDAGAPDLRPVLRAGLAKLDEKARARGAEDFTGLSAPERAAALRELADEDPGFLPGIVYHGYAHYYRIPAVLEALGLEPRPPFPGGYTMQPFDPETLATIRKRPPFYREVD